MLRLRYVLAVGFVALLASPPDSLASAYGSTGLPVAQCAPTRAHMVQRSSAPGPWRRPKAQVGHLDLLRALVMVPPALEENPRLSFVDAFARALVQTGVARGTAKEGREREIATYALFSYEFRKSWEQIYLRELAGNLQDTRGRFEALVRLVDPSATDKAARIPEYERFPTVADLTGKLARDFPRRGLRVRQLQVDWVRRYREPLTRVLEYRYRPFWKAIIQDQVQRFSRQRAKAASAPSV